MYTLGQIHREGERSKIEGGKKEETSKLCLLSQASSSCPTSSMTGQNESFSIHLNSVELFKHHYVDSSIYLPLSSREDSYY